MTAMKIKREHYEILLSGLGQALHTIDPDRHLGELLLDDRVGNVAKRFRWDLLHISSISSRWIIDNIYPYANDDHLDTALRKAITELEPTLHHIRHYRRRA